MSRMVQGGLAVLVCAGLAIVGCSRGGVEMEVPRYAMLADSANSAGATSATATLAVAREGVTARFAANGADQPPAALPGTSRKIIYSAQVELVVEDFSGTPEKVTALIGQHHGYLADSSLSGTSGSNRRATWKVRIPVTEFEQFVVEAKELGELVSAKTTSQDVSDEYYDVEARIRNKTREEERLLKLLEERPGQLSDVVAIERELSRVREELERMQGRLKMLADLTAMTNVEIAVSEIRGYQPPQAPSLATRLWRSFGGSVGALGGFCEGLLILIVALIPWLPVLAGVAAGGYFVVRAAARRLRARVVA